tara:strand:+ start:2926 stop:3387 length:462 start_codon:yes stop_codon:yes gene_type:complete
MQILLPIDVLNKMRCHMHRAGRREIGGIIMGEEVEDQKFRIVDFSVDCISGSHSNFVRDAEQHNQALTDFFERTGANYRRYNYLGEWHTHPSYEVQPSLQDLNAMKDLVDGSGGVEFAVLLITRLKWCSQLEFSASLFVKDREPIPIDLVHEK